MKPGKPAILGCKGAKPILGVPGYPVSGIIVIEQLLKPLVDHWLKAPAQQNQYAKAILTRPVVSGLKYEEFVRVRMGYVGDKYRDAGIRAYRGIINNFIRVNEDKTISLTNCCSVAGLGPGISEKVLKAAPKVKENRRRDGSYEYYLSEPVRDNDAKGIGPFIWASLEMEQLGRMQ
jgi:hypothetical protein